MKTRIPLYTSLLFLIPAVATAGNVLLDFNDHVAGDISQAGNSGTGIGFTEPLWNPAQTNQVLYAGDLTSTVTGYSAPTAGTALSYGSPSAGGQQERQITTLGAADPVWISFLAVKPTSGGRAGINFNNTGTASGTDPRLIWLNDSFQFRRTGNTQVTVAFPSSATTALVVARITINEGGGANVNDRVEVWLNPTDVSSPAALGAPIIDDLTNDSFGNSLTRLNPSVYGDANARIDNVRLSDDPVNGFNVVMTGVAPAADPVLTQDTVGGAADLDFGENYAASSPATTAVRTVRYTNDGPTEDIEITTLAFTGADPSIFSVTDIGLNGTGGQSLPITLNVGDFIDISVQGSATTGERLPFTATLNIDTDEDVTDPQDTTLAASAGLHINGEKLNDNPSMDDNLTSWGGGASHVGPGLVGGSSGMARVKGVGDAIAGAPDSLYQATGVPNGASDWQFACLFTPADAASFADRAGRAIDASLDDRTFQFVVQGSNNAVNPNLDNARAAETIINLGYFPAGTATDPTAGFYLYDGAAWTLVSSLGTIAGSIDVDTDANPLNGVGDGLLDAATGDTVNAYRLVLTGTGFGTGGATYRIDLLGGEIVGVRTASGLTTAHSLAVTAATPSSYAFTSSDTSTSSNANGGVTTSFWVDEACYVAGTGPDPAPAVSPAPAVALFGAATTGTTSFFVRNDGVSNSFDVTSIGGLPAGFTLLSPGLPFTLTPGNSQEVQLQFDSAALAPLTAVVGTVIINGDPALSTAVSGTVATFSNLIANYDFESPGTDAAGDTDTFAVWNETGTATAVTDVPGLLAGSATAAKLSRPGGAFSNMRATLATPVNDFVMEIPFALPPAGAGVRRFNINLLRVGNGQINIRYIDDKWQAFSSVWNTINDLTATPLLDSIDADLNGSLNDGGDTKNVYVLRVTGYEWGTVASTYDVEILDSVGTTIGVVATGLSHFQNSSTGGGASELLISDQYDNNPGYWVDDISFSGTAFGPVETYAAGFGLSGGDLAPTADPEPDGLNNLLEFAFGMDPSISDNVPLESDGSVNGTPIIVFSGGGGGLTFEAHFVRRDDFGSSGSVIYTPQFSSDLTIFYDSTATPTFVANSAVNGEYEVVSIPYPALLPDGKKARFFRMKVELAP